MHPILFEIGSFPVRAYGVMIMLGIVLGTWLSYRVAVRHGRYADNVVDFLTYAFFGAVAGARLWEVAFKWSYYKDHLSEIPAFWQGGLSIQGAIAGGILTLIWYTRKHKLDVWKFADIAAPGLVLGQAVGRAGCVLNGDAFGKPTGSDWGLVYVPGTPAYDAFPGGPDGSLPLWPAEGFEGLWDLAIVGFLLWFDARLGRSPSRPSGVLMLSYLVLYSVGRFGLEFLRADSLIIGGMKAAQLSSVIVAVAAAALLVWRLRGGAARSLSDAVPRL